MGNYKTRGRKHSPGEKHLLQQVAKVFSDKKKELGAKEAAKQLGVSLASFYNYAAGEDLPRMEVLRDAVEKKWIAKWDLVDLSQIINNPEVVTSEQYVFSFIDALRKENVEIARIGPASTGTLEISLRIHFPG